MKRGSKGALRSFKAAFLGGVMGQMGQAYILLLRFLFLDHSEERSSGPEVLINNNSNSDKEPTMKQFNAIL